MSSTTEKASLTRLRKISLLVILLIMVSSLFAGNLACSTRPPDILKIGVLLPLTGPDSLDSREVLDWGVKGLNASGGIGGIPVELVYKDTFNRDTLTLAREFIDDPAIKIVIGPRQSKELHEIAPLFIENKKLLISPAASAGNILRAYANKGFIWRTVQSDVAQVRSILYELAIRKVSRISLIYTEDDYGQTFLEWTGFFCVELGIDLLNSVGYRPSSGQQAALDEALSGEPEYIITVAFAADTIAFIELLDGRDTAARLFFTDAAESPFVIEKLGIAAEGIEVMSPAADPDAGFETAYLAEFGYYPWDCAAPTYDAFLLAVYTLTREEYSRKANRGAKRETVADSIIKVISGTGTNTKWHEYIKAIELILKGDLPDVNGAASPLNFDSFSGVDPTESFYSLNRVETREGITDFFTIRRFSSSDSEGIGLLDGNTSAVSTRASLKYLDLNTIGPVFHPGSRENLQAVIVSLSAGLGQLPAPGRRFGDLQPFEN